MKSVSRIFFASVPLLCALLFITPAGAGTYSVAYTGGILETSQQGTESYYADDQGTGDLGDDYVQGPDADPYVKCSGTLTATFTWVPDNNDDTPPSSVIIAESCSVDAEVDGGQGNPWSATIDDDMGDPVTEGVYAKGVSGQRYTVKSDPGTSFSVSCSPSAYITISSGEVQAAVRYIATPTPVPMVVVGLTNKSVLIGQGLNASLTTGSYKQSNWQWTISGDPFAGFQVTQTTGKALELTDDMKNQATLAWFYRSVSGASSTVTCTATVTLPNGTQKQVKGTKTITVAQPAYPPLTTTPGTTDIWDVQGAGQRLQPGNIKTGRGIQWEGKVTTPPAFTGNRGYGQWGFAQTVTAQISYTDANKMVHTFPQQNQPGLDANFPYGGFTAPADGTLHNTGDTPHFDCGSNLAIDMGGTFQTCMLYQPPSSLSER